MSTETLTKLNPKILINSKLDPNGSDITSSDPKISNKDLNKVASIKSKKNKDKICINKLTDRLKKKRITKNLKIEFCLDYF